jgi:hypothetical protein
MVLNEVQNLDDFLQQNTRLDEKNVLPYAARMAKQTKSQKLSKNDPEFYSKIAAIAGKKLVKKRGTNYFSELAKKSHPRTEYHGGRPRKEK